MTEKDQSNSTLRRTFMKGAAATGVAATGVTAFSGSAAAQQNIRRLNVRDIQVADGLLTVQVQNVNVLRDFDEINVTIIGGDVFGDEVNVVRDVEVIFEDRVINIDLEDINVDILREGVVQVAVAVLGGPAGNIVAEGSNATNDLDTDELD